MARPLKPKQLESELEQLEVPGGSAGLEQYPTPPHIAAHLLWEISEHCGSIRNEAVLDLGCGNGILGLGCLLLGAKFVVAVDIDYSMIEVAKNNAKSLGFTEEEHIHFINQDVQELDISTLSMGGIDTAVMNPPFGTRDQTGIDAIFVCKALKSARTVYSMHKSSTQKFWKKKAAELGAEVKVLTQMKFNVDQRFRFHKCKSVDIEVDLVQFRNL